MDGKLRVSKRSERAPLCNQGYDLDEMLADMNEDNLHPEQDTGPDQGREEWWVWNKGN